MKFSKDYSKLDKPIFTTIRKKTIAYALGGHYKIKSPTKEFLENFSQIFWKKSRSKEVLRKEDLHNIGRRTFGISLWSGDVGRHREAGTPNTKAPQGISWRIPAL